MDIDEIAKYLGSFLDENYRVGEEQNHDQVEAGNPLQSDLESTDEEVFSFIIIQCEKQWLIW